MDLIGAKVLALFIILFLKFASGVAPLVLNKFLRKRKSKELNRFMYGVLCVGGGILLATVFIHMLPEVREGLAMARNYGYMPMLDEHYPLAELIICMGFFLIYIIECIAHRFFGAFYGHSHETVVVQHCSNNTCNEQTAIGGPCSPTCIYRSTTTLSSSSDCSHEAGQSKTSGNNCRTEEWQQQQVHSNGDCCEVVIDASCKVTIPKTIRTVEEITDPKSDVMMLAYIRSLLLVMAISVHSVFEGMAVGLQLSLSDMWKLFGAILFHALAIMFCIGTEILVSGISKTKALVYILTLSIVTPVGIVIGILVTENSESGPQILVVGILQGLAAGTLLYITFYEVLDKNKMALAKLNGLLGCFLVVLGFVIMTGIEALGEHSHTSHGHGEVKNNSQHAWEGSHTDSHVGHDHNPRRVSSLHNIPFDVGKEIESIGERFGDDTSKQLFPMEDDHDEHDHHSDVINTDEHDEASGEPRRKQLQHGIKI